ncbi:alpha-glucan family phosphorylase, partial [Candidatus Aerophobetes bacterium]|nr:alpha-glucan family phosphorylase [Candidatus Aerophobetes bacterium]
SRPAWKISLHNPVKTLNMVDEETFSTAAKDPDFLEHYETVMRKFKEDMSLEKTWFQENMANVETAPVAYFSAEYGLHHSLPFYAGGLGFLSGDFLKECSDLGVPVVGVGFMYPQGYLRQRITLDGWQMSEEQPLDRENAPVSVMLNEKKKPLVVQVPFVKPPIHFAVWKIHIGRVSLYLLDTDIQINEPWNRDISARLYAGDAEQRLRQQIVIGMGGIRLLNTLGIKYSLLHLNEDYPAFAIFERIREKVEKGASYKEASDEVRKTTVFTTHTPVSAGSHIFPFFLMDKYFSSYWEALKMDREPFFQLGINPEEPEAGFNMTCFALRMSACRNAVSKRHGKITRRMWHSLWPDVPEDKVPIDHITNGVHVPSWIEPRMEFLFNRYLGSDWLKSHDNQDIWELIDNIPDKQLWKTHYWLKMKLITRIRARARQRLREGADPRIILGAGVLLDPDVLTIGFARRFATYKRAALILQDIERLKKIVRDRWKPLQLIFAGKAHPDDNPGKKLLQEVFKVAEDASFGGRIAFVEDYDEQLAQYMVHGVDVWLNNPLPPFEASGTSGMKATLNGVPHLSILDGWWVEGFNGKNGWAFGKENTESKDVLDAKTIYNIIENQVIPTYYKVDEDGIPREWVRIMKEAIKSTAHLFSARRMVKEYVKKFYQSTSALSV